MDAEMIATASGKAQIHYLHDVTAEIEISSRSITRRILNDCLNCVMTLNSGNFQSDSRHLRLRYHSIHEAIAKAEIETMHVAGTETLADALTKDRREVILSEFGEEIKLR
jgi:hypothetical protein